MGTAAFPPSRPCPGLCAFLSPATFLSSHAGPRTALPPSTQLARWEGRACTQRGSQPEGPQDLPSPVSRGCEGQQKAPGVCVPEARRPLCHFLAGSLSADWGGGSEAELPGDTRVRA